MENGFQFFDIILFAAIAAFFVFRLRGVLGKRGGHEQKPYSPRGNERREEKVIPLPDRARVEPSERPSEAERSGTASSQPGSPLEATLAQIQLADRDFSLESFLAGARTAFEMVVSAFARGDRKVLRPLLANDVYEDFAGAIDAREKQKQSLETTLVGIHEAEAIEAELQGKTALLTVKFVSEQVNVLRDATNEIVEGDPSHVTRITDIWTFARNLRSRDPNWTLVATRSPN